MKKDILITGAHAADLCGVSPPTFYRMAKEEKGLEPVRTTGSAVVWSLKAVMKWIERRAEEEASRRERLISTWLEAGGDAVNT